MQRIALSDSGSLILAGKYEDYVLLVMDSQAKALLWTGPRIGGREASALGLAIDSDGHALVAGVADMNQHSGPVTIVLGQDGAGLDGFVAKVDIRSRKSLFTAFIARAPAGAVAADARGDFFLAGYTPLASFPSTQRPNWPIFTSYRDLNLYLMRFSSNGDQVRFAMIIGDSPTGVHLDVLRILVDSSGRPIIIGNADRQHPTTNDALFPGTRHFEKDPSSYDGFITRLNASGDALSYSTYYGGLRDDTISDAVFDLSGGLIFGGTTEGHTFPQTEGNVTMAFPEFGAFLARIDLQSEQRCSVQIPSDDLRVPLEGMTLTIPVTAPDGCPWAAVIDHPLATYSPQAGIGSGQVRVTFPAYPATGDVAGQILIGGRTIKVHQDGVICPPPMPVSRLDISASGEILRFFRYGLMPICRWFASTDSPWIKPRTNSFFEGSGEAIFEVEPLESGERIGTVTIDREIIEVYQSVLPRLYAEPERLNVAYNPEDPILEYNIGLDTLGPPIEGLTVRIAGNDELFDTRLSSTRTPSILTIRLRKEIVDSGRYTEIIVDSARREKETTIYFSINPYRNTPPRGASLSSAAESRVFNLAPGMLSRIRGDNYSYKTFDAPSTPVTSLAGLSIEITDFWGTKVLARMLKVEPSQITFMVPEGIATGNGTVRVLKRDEESDRLPVRFASFSPSLFSAQGNGRGAAAGTAVVNGGNGVHRSVPLARCTAAGGFCSTAPVLVREGDKVVLTLYGSGLRGLQGHPDVRASVGGQPAVIAFVGPQPGNFPGLDQANILLDVDILPVNVDLPVTIGLGNFLANPVMVRLQRAK